MKRMDFEFYYSRRLVNGRELTIDDILTMEDQAGIDVFVLMPPPDHRPDNRRVVEAIQGIDRIIGCCQVNPHFGQEAVHELERAVLEWGMKSLKLMPTIHGYPIEDTLVDPLMRKARELGIPVNIHSGTHNAMPLEIAALAKRYPDVPIIMDHMGYRFAVSQAIMAAKWHPNIWLGTTIVNSEPWLVGMALRELGPHRIVFGSNGPSCFPDLAVESILRLNLGQEAEDLILGGNLARIYGIDS